MRVFEIVERDLGQRRRVVVAVPEGEDLRPALRLSDDIEVVDLPSDADCAVSPVDGLLVLAVDVRSGGDGLRAGLARIAVDGSAVVLVAEPASLLPVGRLVDAFVAAELQVRGVTPLSSGRWSLAVSVTRTAALLPLRPYLTGEPQVALGHRQLLRLVAEHQLEGFALRSRLDGEGQVLDHDPEAIAPRRTPADRRAAQLTARVAELEGQLATARHDSDVVGAELRGVQQRLEAVESSRSLALGRAMVAARRHPVRGARRALDVVRGRIGPVGEP